MALLSLRPSRNAAAAPAMTIGAGLFALAVLVSTGDLAIAQTATPGATPAHPGGKHASGPAGDAKRGQPQGKLAEREQTDRQLRAAYEKWERSIIAQVKTAAQERASQIRRAQQMTHGQPPHGAAPSAIAGTGQGQRPGPPPPAVPAATRLAGVSAPKFPALDPPGTAILGGAAAEAKNRGVLAGGEVHRKP
jgi:hypothetical protein